MLLNFPLGEKLRRLEKIEVLKRKWKKNDQQHEKETPEKHGKDEKNENENWSIWRKRKCEELEMEDNEIGGRGGSFPKAFPIPNSAPPEVLQVGTHQKGRKGGPSGWVRAPPPSPQVLKFTPQKIS